MDSIGSKPTYRKGLLLSPAKENVKIDFLLMDMTKAHGNIENRSKSLMRSLSRQKESRLENNSRNANHKLQRNQSDLIGGQSTISRTHKRELTHSITNTIPVHNPITNPINQHNPYSKYAKDRILNDTQPLYNF